MINLTINRIESLNLHTATAWLPGECMQARGQEEMWMRQRPEVLETLREQAIIQSAESSNRIEGVTIAAARLRSVVLGKARPLDWPEEELAGYRRALNWIFSRKRRVPLSPDVIRKLHVFAQGGSTGDVGQYKSRNNEIIEILPNGERRVRFVPTSARETPLAVQALSDSYQRACAVEQLPILPLIATCVFDLLCIDPFRDGNGRVSRLLTTFLLLQEGFSVCRYISLERLVEDRKEEYYSTLALARRDGTTGGVTLTLGGTILFPSCGKPTANLRKGSKTLRDARPRPTCCTRPIMDQIGPFSLSEILATVPAASPQLVKKVPLSMKKEGAVRLTGRGRGALWEALRKEMIKP